MILAVLAVVYYGAASVMLIVTPQVFADVLGVGAVNSAADFCMERAAGRDLAMCALFIAGLVLRESRLPGWAFAFLALVEAQDAFALLLGAARGELPGVASNPGAGVFALAGMLLWVTAAVRLLRRLRHMAAPA